MIFLHCFLMASFLISCDADVSTQLWWENQDLVSVSWDQASKFSRIGPEYFFIWLKSRAKRGKLVHSMFRKLSFNNDITGTKYVWFLQTELLPFWNEAVSMVLGH